MLFPFRHSTLFRNRWLALAWAAATCISAVELVDSLAPAPQPTGTATNAAAPDDQASEADIAAALKALDAATTGNAT